jgi:glycosyltransferase involved in cell wall biosynthesis
MRNMNDMEANPLVSVVVTTYDRPLRCKRAVKSVQAQTYEPLEVLVVEDGTDTDVEAWLKDEFPEAEYIRHSENRGLAAARNTGLEWASGDFVAYLDDDDTWKPGRIEHQIEELKSQSPESQSKIGVVYCAVERRTSNGEVERVSYPENSGDLRVSILDVGASTLPSTFLFDRNALRSVDGFDESLASSIDHDIWMSLAAEGYHVLTVDQPLVVSYEADDDTMVTSTYTRVEGVEQYVKKWTPIYKEWLGSDEGVKYGERYFAFVIARLVAAKIERGNFTEAWYAVRKIFAISNQFRYNVRILFNKLTGKVREVALDRLPRPVVIRIRRLKRGVFGEPED